MKPHRFNASYDPAVDGHSSSAGQIASEPRQHEFATFRELYRSRDGRIIVYEDAKGHLTAVNSSRLA